jgi:hypothetical protein
MTPFLKRVVTYNLAVLAVLLLWHLSPAVAAEPAVRCLPLDEARRAMADESHEPFFSILEPREIAAMTGAVSTGTTPEERRDEVRRRFVDAVLPFTPDEERAMLAMTEHLRKLLETHYPLVAREPFQFVKFSRSLVGGFPHTRGPWIFLGEGAVERFVKAWATLQEQNEKGNRDRTIGALTTILHEQMHVLERKYPEKFKSLFTEVYGFRYGPIRSDPWISARRISNPDALRWEWVFPVKREGEELLFAPQMMLRDGRDVPRMGADFQFTCVRVEPAGDGFRTIQKDGRPIVVPLSEVPEYAAAMPIPAGLDHPNELTAYIFEMIFTYDIAELRAAEVPQKTDATKPAASSGLKPEVQRVRTWLRANLR